VHPDLVERAFPPEARVRHAVEGDASRERQRALARLVVEPARQLEQDLLEPPLGAGREIRVPGGPGRALGAARGERLPGDRVDLEASNPHANGGAKRVEEARLAVRRERHDLVLVGRAREAEMLRELLVEDPERVGELLDREGLELRSAIPAREERGSLAAPVEHHHGGGLERPCEVRRRGVRDVMRDEADAIGVEAGKRRSQKERCPLGVQRAQRLPAVRGDVVAAGREARVVRIRDGVEVRGSEPRPSEAPRGGPRGRLPRRERHRSLAVLDPREALLLGGGNDLPVDGERRRRIVENTVDSQHAHVEVIVGGHLPCRFTSPTTSPD
jgi:hypothetical protein